MKIISYVLMAAVLGLPLAGCDSNKGPAEKMGESIDEGLDNTRDKLDDAADEVSDGIEDACEETTDKNC